MNPEEVAKALFKKQMGINYDPRLAAKEVHDNLIGFGISETEAKRITEGLLEEHDKGVTQAEMCHQLFGVKTKGRQPWYAGPSSGGTWGSLSGYLKDQKWSEERIESLKISSQQITGTLNNPGDDKFDCRGMVIGHVQSGKTASMAGVIAMAADAGYDVFIVLSGVTNALRRQTQRRLEREIIRPEVEARWQRWTYEDEDLTEGHRFDPNSHFSEKNKKHLAVIKKNKSPLQVITKFLKEVPRLQLERKRFLIIDDECDQAGVNAASGQQESYDPENPEETNRTAINKKIIELLKMPSRMSYVGYTATPYANILINPTDWTDMFPRHFILCLEPPRNYFGMERIFGRRATDHDDVHSDGIDAIRLIPETELEAMKVTTRGESSFTGELPETLVEAMRYFLLVTSARRLRGQREIDDHSTMMIHFTHLVEPQRVLAGSVRKWLGDIDALIKRKDPGLKKEMRDLWRREEGRVPKSESDDTIDFDDIWDELPNMMAQGVECIEEHGQSDSRLDFEKDDDKKRIYAIIIGGNILSRGLTIEGLSVSYFCRSSKQYDTLSQMGRWFGYREGYGDFARVWMDEALAENFKSIAGVEHEIREMIESLHEREATPEQAKVRIRKLPHLNIAAKNKMQWLQPDTPDFEGRDEGTIHFKDDAIWQRECVEKASAWISDVQESHPFIQKKNGKWISRDVPITKVMKIIQECTLSNDEQFPSEAIVNHLNEMIEKRPSSACMKWNVVIASNKPKNRAEGCAFTDKITITPYNRSKLEKFNTEGKNPGKISLGAVFGKADLCADYPDDFSPTNKARGEIKELRAEADSHALVRNPLLTIARINKESKSDRKGRADLATAHDLIALQVVFPTTPFTSGAFVAGGGMGVDKHE